MRYSAAILVSVIVISFICFSIGCEANQEPSTSTPTISPTSQPAMPTPTPAVTATQTPSPTATAKPTVTPMHTETGFFLEISQPPDGAQVTASPIIVTGRTSPDAVVSLLVNEEIEIADVDQNGNFSVTIDLEEGPNLIEVIASDQYGNEDSVTIMVSYVP